MGVKQRTTLDLRVGCALGRSAAGGDTRLSLLFWVSRRNVSDKNPERFQSGYSNDEPTESELDPFVHYSSDRRIESKESNQIPRTTREAELRRVSTSYLQNASRTQILHRFEVDSLAKISFVSIISLLCNFWSWTFLNKLAKLKGTAKREIITAEQCVVCIYIKFITAPYALYLRDNFRHVYKVSKYKGLLYSLCRLGCTHPRTQTLANVMRYMCDRA